MSELATPPAPQHLLGAERRRSSAPRTSTPRPTCSASCARRPMAEDATVQEVWEALGGKREEGSGHVLQEDPHVREGPTCSCRSAAVRSAAVRFRFDRCSGWRRCPSGRTWRELESRQPCKDRFAQAPQGRLQNSEALGNPQQCWRWQECYSRAPAARLLRSGLHRSLECLPAFRQWCCSTAPWSPPLYCRWRC